MANTWVSKRTGNWSTLSGTSTSPWYDGAAGTQTGRNAIPANADTSVTIGKEYTFTVTAANATVGATYTNSTFTFTVLSTIAGTTSLACSATGAPGASGTLTKSGGTGDSTITYSAVSPKIGSQPISSITSTLAAAVSTAFARTNDTTGTLTLSTGHGITTGAIINITWSGGSRQYVTVGTVSTNSVPISAGIGNPLPAANTVITIGMTTVTTSSAHGFVLGEVVYLLELLRGQAPQIPASAMSVDNLHRR